LLVAAEAGAEITLTAVVAVAVRVVLEQPLDLPFHQGQQLL
jgi:hypothetical protein